MRLALSGLTSLESPGVSFDFGSSEVFFLHVSSFSAMFQVVGIAPGLYPLVQFRSLSSAFLSTLTAGVLCLLPPGLHLRLWPRPYAPPSPRPVHCLGPSCLGFSAPTPISYGSVETCLCVSEPNFVSQTLTSALPS